MIYENKYESRIREIAEEMLLQKEPGLALGKHSIGGRQYALLLISERIDSYIPLARIAVAHMADQYRRGFDAGYFNQVADDVTIDEWLQAIGLIPSPEQNNAI